MTQSAKTLMMMAVLLVLAGGVGLYAYYGVYEKDAAETKKKEHDARLFAPQRPGEQAPDGGSPPADFVRLTVAYKGENTTLEREPGKDWRLVSPVQAAADKLVLDALVSQLQTAKFKATLEDSPDPATLQKYGLDTPVFVVEAQARVGSEIRTVKLEGGIENTFDGSVFMRKDGQPQVYSAEGGVRYALAKTTFELRDKQPFAMNEADLVKVQVKAKVNAYSLERNAEKQWAITAPEAELADPQQITGVLGSFFVQRAQKFPPDTPENRKAFGLDAPQVDATFTRADGKAVRIRVAKGGTPEAFYGLREDEHGALLAEMPEAALHDLDRNINDLKDRTLVRFKKELATKLVFHNADGSEVVVGKDSPDASAEAWKVLAPREGKALIYKVTSALWVLSSLKASERVDEHPKDPGKYGLGPQSRFISVLGPDGELARLTIGDAVKGKPDTFYARGSRPAIVEVDGSRFKEFPSILGDVLEQPKDAGP
ncbi:MAG: DUF4340 domain-containing protein [Myxococcales bacterium]|nr:DUF4340 domain-containing protein [Myxococcales bacterium]